MKIRETINGGAERYSAVVYEDNNKVKVRKHDAFNYQYDPSADEWFEFSSVSEYRAWISAQAWVVPEKVKMVSAFKKVMA